MSSKKRERIKKPVPLRTLPEGSKFRCGKKLGRLLKVREGYCLVEYPEMHDTGTKLLLHTAGKYRISGETEVEVQ